MITLQMMDSMLNEVQRQGKISLYLASTGEEATNTTSAAALSGDDIVLAQVSFRKMKRKISLRGKGKHKTRSEIIRISAL